MKSRDKIAVLDFGGQYAHLIANRIRRLGVFSEIVEPETDAAQLESFAGLIFSGGPHSVYDKGRPDFNEKILDLNKPVLGLCYGHQLISHHLGGKVKPGKTREFGEASLTVGDFSDIFSKVNASETVWMSHGDTVSDLPEGFDIIGFTKDCPAAAVRHAEKKIFGFQFHPEVTHTPNGNTMLRNFLDLCNCGQGWSMEAYIEEMAEALKEKIGERNVFLLVSGGVDSTVAFALLNRVLGEERVLGLHIDNGLMRQNETAMVKSFLKVNNFHNLKIEDAGELFLSRLKEVYEPEAKRRIIGDTFIDVQQSALEKLKLDPDKWVLGQGTIYPDTIESGGTKNAALIKTHHNRVPMIEELIKQGRIVEPLAELYKDEVRDLGEQLGIARDLVWRHPFPGPGLGVRTLCSEGDAPALAAEDLARVKNIAGEHGFSVYPLPLKSVGVQGDFRTYAHPVVLQGPKIKWDTIGRLSTEITNQVKSVNRVLLELGKKAGGPAKAIKTYITRERLDVLRPVDERVTQFLREKGLYDKIWQMPVVSLPLGFGEATTSIVLRPINSSEAMTASFYPIKFNDLEGLVKEILDYSGVAAVFYDTTNKPPGTIEWE